MKKHPHKPFLAVMFALKLVSTLGQDGEYVVAASSDVMEVVTWTGSQWDDINGNVPNDTLGQAIYSDGSSIHSVSFVVFSMYSLADREAELIIRIGGPYGPTIYSGVHMIPGLNRIIPASALDTISNHIEAWQAFSTLWDSTGTVMTFPLDSIMTTFMLNNLMVPSGELVFLIRIDPLIPDIYTNGYTALPVLVLGANCPQVTCQNGIGPPGPYADGHIINFGGQSPLAEYPGIGAGMDATFRLVVEEDVSTGIAKPLLPLRPDTPLRICDSRGAYLSNKLSYVESAPPGIYLVGQEGCWRRVIVQ